MAVNHASMRGVRYSSFLVLMIFLIELLMRGMIGNSQYLTLTNFLIKDSNVSNDNNNDGVEVILTMLFFFTCLSSPPSGIFVFYLLLLKRTKPALNFNSVITCCLTTRRISVSFPVGRMNLRVMPTSTVDIVYL